MSILRQELAEYGKKVEQRGLTAGAGGNLSAREGRIVWVKPSGFSMAEIQGRDMCGIDLASGRQVEGRHRPTSELPMHLELYRRRPEINCIFHTHPPYATGVASSDADFRPMVAEVVLDLGHVAKVPYVLPSTKELAEAVARAAADADTILMKNHGMVCMGKSLRQAFFRCCVAEDAAKTFVAASIAGRPHYLNEAQIVELKGLPGGDYRNRIVEGS